ncbi:hypothetical protein AB0O91_30250 [Kitasatospora sp. NPDC089797]|uniref:hypothetical protein n=1 Tax=Kitasatospora sp. NPDC089797 TaxID=3155298 RepID=UPI0034227085
MRTLARVPPHVLGGRWLAGVSSRPGHIQAGWRRGGPALLPVSCRFDVVIVVGTALTRAVVDELHGSGQVIGPVLYDHGAETSSWLVPVRPGAAWQMRSTVLLTALADGRDPPLVALPAPGVGRVASLEWLVQPDGSGTLTRHSDLAVALRRARPALNRSVPAASPGLVSNSHAWRTS